MARTVTILLVVFLMGGVSSAEEEFHLSEYTAILPDWSPESEVDVSSQMGRGMVIYEVTRFPHLVEPSKEQMAGAVAFEARARAAIRKRGWDDFDQAVADGFTLMYGDDNHYANREFIADGQVLDPERPEFLIYYDTGESLQLAGLMFLAPPGDHGPQIAGPMSLWHFHIWDHKLCLWEELLVTGLAAEGCEQGEGSHRSPEMLHLWFFDHPQGLFATGMDLEPWQIQRLDEIEF